MLDNGAILRSTERVVRESEPPIGLERVIAASAVDSEGQDALAITLVLEPAAVKSLTGDQAIDLLVAIRRTLESEGEDRFPIVQYATEEELQHELDRGLHED